MNSIPISSYPNGELDRLCELQETIFNSLAYLEPEEFKLLIADVCHEYFMSGFNIGKSNNEGLLGE